MKKNLTAIALLGALSLNAYAGENFIQLGASNLDFGGESATGFNLGIGTDNYKENGLYYGAVFNVDSGKVNNEKVIGFGMDIKLGYTFMKDWTGYGLVGWNLQGIYDTPSDEFNNYRGFGGGLGLQYKISESFAVNVESRTYNLKFEDVGEDLKYKTTSINLKWIY